MSKKNYVILTFLVVLALSNSALAKYSQDYSRTEVMKMVAEEAIRQDVSPELALSIARTESDFQYDVVSSAGAVGVMQIMPLTARSEFGLNRSDLFDPTINIRTGIQFLKDLTNKYGRLDIALSHYNGGSAVRAKNGSLRVIPATRNYVDKVIKGVKKYRHSPLIANVRDKSAYSYSYSDISSMEINERARLVTKLRQLQSHNNARYINQESTPEYRGYSESWARKDKRTQVKSWESIYD